MSCGLFAFPSRSLFRSSEHAPFPVPWRSGCASSQSRDPHGAVATSARLACLASPPREVLGAVLAWSPQDQQGNWRGGKKKHDRHCPVSYLTARLLTGVRGDRGNATSSSGALDRKLLLAFLYGLGGGMLGIAPPLPKARGRTTRPGQWGESLFSRRSLSPRPFVDSASSGSAVVVGLLRKRRRHTLHAMSQGRTRRGMSVTGLAGVECRKRRRGRRSE